MVRAAPPIVKTHSPSDQYPQLTTPARTYAPSKTTFSTAHSNQPSWIPPSPSSQCSSPLQEGTWSMPGTQRTTPPVSYHQLMRTSLRRLFGMRSKLWRLPGRSARASVRGVSLCLYVWGGWLLAATGGGCSGDRRLGHQTVSVLSIEDLVSYLKVVGRLLMFGRKVRGRAGLTRSLRFCRSEEL